MTVFLSNRKGDAWNFIFERGTLDFSIILKGKIHRGILDYQVAHSSTTIPIIVTKVSKFELRIYIWDFNKWKMKKFIFEKAINNFYVSRNANKEFHILLELEAGSNNDIIHLFYFGGDWFSINHSFSSCKIIDLNYLSEENKLLLTIFSRKNRNLETYIWNNLVNKWEKWNIAFEIPKGQLLSVAYSKDIFHFLTLIKNDYYSINYKRLCINKNYLLAESNIIMLPAFYPKISCFLKDNSEMAIYCTNLKESHFYFMKNHSQWAEAPIKKIASPQKIFKVYDDTGYINASLAFYELFNINLKFPVLLNISEILKLLKIKI